MTAQGINMFPKSSTLVDQTLEYDSIHSQLSVFILDAFRTYVVAQKSSKLFQTPLKVVNSYERRGEVSTLCDFPILNT